LWALQQARGEFIATLDGDDFWTDPNKLHKQVELLHANPDCAGCFHNTVILNADNEIQGHILASVSPTKLTQLDLIKDPTQFGHTSSLFFRATSVRNIPKSFHSSMCDRILVYLVAESGFWIGTDEVMSTYRLHPQGIYSPVQKSNQLNFMLGIYQSLRADKSAFQQYKPTIKKKTAYYHHELMKLFRMEGKFSLYVRHLFGYIQNEQKNARLLKILIKEELLNRKN
jgi:glycosyltransferase involved in cell wall biosynthesis